LDSTVLKDSVKVAPESRLLAKKQVTIRLVSGYEFDCPAWLVRCSDKSKPMWQIVVIRGYFKLVSEHKTMKAAKAAWDAMSILNDEELGDGMPS
jgi:hypothetical protein